MDITRLPDDILDPALKTAAETLIQCLHTMPELRGAKVAIIGGMAVKHHLEGRRRTYVSGLKNQIYQLVLTRACILVQDVDVLLFRPDRPIDYQLMRKELVSRFSGLFKERAGPLFFKYKHTVELKKKRKAKRSYFVQVDIIPDYLPPYLPAQAITLEDVDIGHLPFVNPLDLLSYKVHCSSLRPCLRKRTQDAKDAVKLWQAYYGEEYVPLSKGQRDAIASGVDLMAEFSRNCRWRKWRLRQWVNL
ncbi:hypothetical protein Aspvir_002396 [Aspergillus viridinutans]|uniref:Uncharacterized protein n=1 Tax=Aspergillus viridinutans TaxID=75553 RepID=A0A9P3FA76_ASPVI|nr:uncharacterized protein Aspvir_002396 [Aspergillus viridinutans]GIK06746.1 hypothetical protein Aspvir_002396 [Aspergillus viridinutans]